MPELRYPRSIIDTPATERSASTESIDVGLFQILAAYGGYVEWDLLHRLCAPGRGDHDLLQGVAFLAVSFADHTGMALPPIAMATAAATVRGRIIRGFDISSYLIDFRMSASAGGYY